MAEKCLRQWDQGPCYQGPFKFDADDPRSASNGEPAWICTPLYACEHCCHRAIHDGLWEQSMERQRELVGRVLVG